MSSRGKPPGPHGSFCSKPDCRRVRDRLRMRDYNAKKAAELGESYYRPYRAAQNARRKARIAAGEEPSKRQRWPETYKAGDDLRRARKTGAEVERFGRREIYERDGWRCGICGLPVNPARRYPDQSCASLDHIIPLSKGGAHTKTNCRLAHLGCNTRRQANEDWIPPWSVL